MLEMKKYELDTSRKIFLGNSQHLYFVYRIRALKDFRFSGDKFAKTAASIN